MAIEYKEWWDVIAIGRYDEFDHIKNQAEQQGNNEKHYFVDENGKVPRPKLSLKRPRSPHTNIYAELNGVTKRISVVDTNLSISLHRGGLVRWENGALQFTSNIELPPVNFVVSKVENIGAEAVAFIKRAPRESRRDTHR